MKACVILWDGSTDRLSEETKTVLSRAMVSNENAVSIESFEYTDQEVAQILLRYANPTNRSIAIKSEEDEIDETIVASLDYLNKNYSELVKGDSVKLALQIISDINAGTVEAQMLKSCITTIAKCPKSLRQYKIPTNLLSVVKLIYKNHFV